ncbi:MAG: thiamine phosphate synthase [Gammaproteobacteria bacterium]|nr:thiamine phosphate synthase [Gammaproteobacteria bacterium]MBL6999708.1 thiamine phosphate synthase [Gammaproteobacteria bacterium]
MTHTLVGLYGITDPILLPDTQTLINAVEAALQGGMRVLQYRAKNLDQATRLQQATALQVLCQRHQALFIINDDVALAQAVSADGVHLGREDMDIAAAREQLGKQAIIGCSCYDRLDLALSAEQQGADYVAFGRFFPSSTKPQASPADPDLLITARQQLQLPICAIGGITAQNAAQLLERGADMIAVIHELFAAQDVYRQAKQFSQLI